MGSQTAFLNVTDDQEHDKSEFFILTLWEFLWVFYTKVKRNLTEPWKVSHAIQWYFCTCPFELFPSFVLVWRREAHLQQVPCVRSSLCLLSPALWSVCGFRVSSVAAQNWVFTTQIIPFFPQEITDTSSLLSNFWLLLSIINALGEEWRKRLKFIANQQEESFLTLHSSWFPIQTPLWLK